MVVKQVTAMQNEQWRRYNQVHVGIIDWWHLGVPQLHANPLSQVLNPIPPEFSWWR